MRVLVLVQTYKIVCHSGECVALPNGPCRLRVAFVRQSVGGIGGIIPARSGLAACRSLTATNQPHEAIEIVPVFLIGYALTECGEVLKRPAGIQPATSARKSIDSRRSLIELELVSGRFLKALICRPARLVGVRKGLCLIVGVEGLPADFVLLRSRLGGQ